MAETLVELVARITADATSLQKVLKDSEKDVDKSAGKIKKSITSIKNAVSGISTAWAGVGAVIVGGLGSAAKAAMDAVESENLFTVSLGHNAQAAREWSKELSKALGLNEYELRKNVGTFYVMLSSMGLTSDAAYEMSTSMTELAYDMASFYNLRPEEAFDKIKSGIVGMPRPLQDLGIVINETAAQTYALKNGLIEQGEEMTNQQKVTARYGALLEQTGASQGDLGRTLDSPTNKLRIMGSVFDELKIIIGENILPALSSLMDMFGGLLRGVKEWVSNNPQLVKAFVAAGVAIAAVIAVVMALKGAMILLGTTANLMFGGILILVGLLVTAGVLLAQNWDKVVDFFKRAWSNIKIFFLQGVEKVLSTLNKFTAWIPGLGDKIKEVHDKIADMIAEEEVKKDAREVEKTIEGMTDKIREELEAQKAEALSALASKKQLAQEEYDNAITKIKEEYGEYKTATKNKMDLARDASEETKRLLEDEMDAKQRAHEETIDLLEREYDQKIRTLNAETEYAVKQIQDQIDAIDEQTRAEELALTRAEEAKKLAELKAAMESATTAEDLAEAKIAYDEYAAEVARNELLRSRAAEKDALRERIDDIRTQAEAEQDRLKTELDANKAHQLAIWEDYKANQERLIAAEDEALEKELVRLDTERQAKEQLEYDKLAATQERLANEEAALTVSFDARLTEAAIYQEALERTLKDVNQTVTTTYVSVGAGAAAVGAAAAGYTGPHPRESGSYQHGGIIDKPTLALMGEQAPGIKEAVIPENLWGKIGGTGDITINFTQPVFFDREDTMHRFVELIRKELRRMDRLNYGGAYSG